MNGVVDLREWHARQRRKAEREAWERQREQQIAEGRARLRWLLGDDDGAPPPPRAA